MSSTAPAYRADVGRLAVAGLRDLPLVGILAALLAEPSTRDFALANLGVQLLLFVVVACIPAARTGVMAYVDGAWPWGLFAIGVLALAFGDGDAAQVAVAAAYLLAGGRLGLWALRVLLTDFPSDDLPRYHYRRLAWRDEGYRTQTLPMLHEIAQQGLCNASVLALPAMLVAADDDPALGAVTIAGLAAWACSWALEALADLQKGRFAKRRPHDTCTVGLWQWSRHPNYFFQWLGWTALSVAALPSLVRLADDLAPLAVVAFAVGLAAIPAAMYYVLVHYTGAIPAEHFSVQHRPGYADYQRRVNRFVPGPPR